MSSLTYKRRDPGPFRDWTLPSAVRGPFSMFFGAGLPPLTIGGLGTVGVFTGAALLGSHAGLSLSSTAGPVTSPRWGISRAEVEDGGTPSLGTGAAPSDFSAADTGNPAAPATLHASGVVNGQRVFAAASIRAALPTITTAAAISATGTDIGDTITLARATFANIPAANTRLLTMTRDGSSFLTNAGGADLQHVIAAADDNLLFDGTDVVTCSGGVVTSDATGSVTVTDFVPPSVVVPPIITSARIGEAVSFTPPVLAGNPTPTIDSYDLLVNGSDVGDENTVLLEAQSDDTVELRVNISNALGSASGTSAGAIIVYQPPQVTGTLADQVFSDDTGLQTIDPVTLLSLTVPGDADLSGVAYDLPVTVPGVTVLSDGRIQFDTDALAQQVDTDVTWRATNSGGTVSRSFQFDIVQSSAPVNPVVTLSQYDDPNDGSAPSLTFTGTYAGADGPLTLNLRYRISGVLQASATVPALVVSGGNFSFNDAVEAGDLTLEGGVTLADAPTWNEIDWDLNEQTNGGQATGTITGVTGLDYVNLQVTDIVASADGLSVTVTFDQNAYGTPDLADYTIRDNAVARTINSISFTAGTNTMVCNLAAAVTSQAVDFSYDGSGDIRDQDGQALLAVSQASVTTRPDVFVDANWAVATGSGSGELDVSIASLPANGGATITDIEYELDASGTWISSGGIADFTITALTAGTSYDVRLRAVNSVGPGLASNTETATSGAAGPGVLFDFNGLTGFLEDQTGWTAGPSHVPAVAACVNDQLEIGGNAQIVRVYNDIVQAADAWAALTYVSDTRTTGQIEIGVFTRGFTDGTGLRGYGALYKAHDSAIQFVQLNGGFASIEQSYSDIAFGTPFAIQNAGTLHTIFANGAALGPAVGNGAYQNAGLCGIFALSATGQNIIGDNFDAGNGSFL